MNTLQRRFLALALTMAGCVGGVTAKAANIVGLTDQTDLFFTIRDTLRLR